MNLSPAPAPDWRRPGMAVFSHTVAWPQPNLLAFLRRGAGQRRFFWESERSPVGFAALGAAVELAASGEGRFRSIRDQAAALFARLRSSTGPDVHPQSAGTALLGGFSFREHPASSCDTQPGIWTGFHQASFVLPRYLLTRRDGSSYLTVNVVAGEHDAWAAHEALWDLPAPLDIPTPDTEPMTVTPRELLDSAGWELIVSAARTGITAGRFQKIVLARALEFRGAGNPLAVLSRLSGRYPDCYRFLIEAGHGHAFFGATPELLVSGNDGRVEAMALAGSMRRGDTLAADEALGERLLSSQKERLEHRLVVQAVADRLAPFLAAVETGETGLLKLSNIQHLHTAVGGRRAAGHLLDIVAALHPTPAVGGLPSGAGLEFIDQAEPVSRGWYAGPVGWFDADGRGEFAVSLRSAVTDGEFTRLYAGAGIVSESDPAREWQETELKFRPMMEALGCTPVRK